MLSLSRPIEDDHKLLRFIAQCEDELARDEVTELALGPRAALYDFLAGPELPLPVALESLAYLVDPLGRPSPEDSRVPARSGQIINVLLHLKREGAFDPDALPSLAARLRAGDKLREEDRELLRLLVQAAHTSRYPSF